MMTFGYFCDCFRITVATAITAALSESSQKTFPVEQPAPPAPKPSKSFWGWGFHLSLFDFVILFFFKMSVSGELCKSYKTIDDSPASPRTWCFFFFWQSSDLSRMKLLNQQHTDNYTANAFPFPGKWALTNRRRLWSYSERCRRWNSLPNQH